MKVKKESEDDKRIMNVDDEKVINKIIDEYQHLTMYYIKKYGIDNNDIEDCMQEGRIAILKATKAFKRGKGSNFETFLNLCIERRIISFLRDKNRKKELMFKSGISLDSQLEFSLHEYIKSPIDVEEEVLCSLYFQDILHNVTETQLTPLEARVYRDYIEGYSINELCENFCLTKKKLYVIISKARKKVEQELQNE